MATEVQVSLCVCEDVADLQVSFGSVVADSFAVYYAITGYVPVTQTFLDNFGYALTASLQTSPSEPGPLVTVKDITTGTRRLMGASLLEGLEKATDHAAAETLAAAVTKDETTLKVASILGQLIQALPDATLQRMDNGLLAGVIAAISAQADLSPSLVIYGGGAGGIAAAITAHATLKKLRPDKTPNIFILKTNTRLGDLATVGGQIFCDIKEVISADGHLVQPQQGTHKDLLWV